MDRAQLKIDGVAFGRALQTAYKTAVMYSVEHPAVDRALQQAHESLQPLLQQMPQLIFGFMNRRLLLNDLLTDEPTLRLLDTEITRRGIAAVTFLTGIDLPEFKQTVNILAVKPKTLEQEGGIRAFLDAHPLARARVHPVKRPEEGDTILGMDTESYLMAGDDLPAQESKPGRALDVLLHCAQVEKAFSAPPSGSDIIELAGKAAETAFLDQKTDPREIASALARVVEEVTPDRFLSSLSSNKQAELRGRPAEDIAADTLEDMTIHWATRRLAAAHEQALTATGEEEALRVMMVGLNMTRMVDRLLQKLSRTLEEANLPPELFDRIQQAVMWHSLSRREKRDRLLQITQYDSQQFRYLFDFVKESLQAKKVDEAVEVTRHYFGFLAAPSPRVQAELPRAVELVRAMAEPVTASFVAEVAERVGAELLDDRHLAGGCHELLVAVLLDLVHMAANHEGFEIAHRVGTALDRSWARDRRRHADCCGETLRQLLPPASAGPLINLYMEKRGDAGLAKTTVDLLTWLGPAGAEAVFERLVEETVAPNRVRLLRLLAEFGPAATEAARKRLSDERWYVVRNACYVLGDLVDPETPQALREVLQHPDARVQQAALAALLKCQIPGSTTALTDSLTTLDASLAEKALDELVFRKDPATVDGLGRFIQLHKGTKAGALEKAVQALAVIPSESAVGALGAVLSDADHALLVRRAAADALMRSPQPAARSLLLEYVGSAPSDPLTAAIRRALERAPAR